MKMHGPGKGESPAKKKLRAERIERLLRKEYPSPEIALEYSNPFQLLIAVILSAQCTDVRVNIVTPSLFKQYPTPRDFANADPAELEGYIHSTGFFRNKAKNIIGCCRALVDNHEEEVPASMEELIKLPGVGRKTANCILGEAFGIPSGIVVDTHVKRVASRLGLTENSNPKKIESDLCELLEKKDWIHVGNALVHHGRQICAARKPLCGECALNSVCPSAVTP